MQFFYTLNLYLKFIYKLRIYLRDMYSIKNHNYSSIKANYEENYYIISWYLIDWVRFT